MDDSFILAEKYLKGDEGRRGKVKRENDPRYNLTEHFYRDNQNLTLTLIFISCVV